MNEKKPEHVLCLTGLWVVGCESWMMVSCCILALLLRANVVNYNENKFQWALFSFALSMGISAELSGTLAGLQDYWTFALYQWALNTPRHQKETI